jgi:hypothetical protein
VQRRGVRNELRPYVNGAIDSRGVWGWQSHPQTPG